MAIRPHQNREHQGQRRETMSTPNTPQSAALAEPAGSASVIVAEGYHRIEGEHEKLKELCSIIEPWAAHHACNNRSVSKLADDVYRACVEMRRIIYTPNHPSPT